MECLLGQEMANWERSTGGTAHLVRPNAAIGRLVRHPLDLFDQARARAAYPMAVEQTMRLLQIRPDLAALTRLHTTRGGGGIEATVAPAVAV
jgi:hypothetical protein